MSELVPLKPGFDPTLASYGLSHLMGDAAARDLINRGIRELEAAPYSRRLATVAEHTLRRRLREPGEKSDISRF